ncbi:hypothetical protein DSL92_01475 [Billgrantia gudaonensis]|uniref:Carbohydrate kinase PfkB domain-containing protein n=1 Tax=Billgrantia gudaonensis TaxID=376427 RepID=A0A3S0QGF0_9GAMM|nr:hypothetical protein DSL92_01475 [Halomonas gudaonensis]
MARVLLSTLNPALDLSIGLERLEPGAVSHSRATSIRPPARNVSIGACWSRWGATSSGFLGADNGTSTRLQALGVEDAFLNVPAGRASA